MAQRISWQDITRDLVDVAMGRRAADLVIRNGRWVNVHSGEILPGTDVAVLGGRIAYVGEDASHTIGDSTTVIDAGGPLPGARLVRCPHACRERHGHRDRVRPGGHPPRHDQHVHRPARDRQRAGAARRAPDA